MMVVDVLQNEDFNENGGRIIIRNLTKKYQQKIYDNFPNFQLLWANKYLSMKKKEWLSIEHIVMFPRWTSWGIVAPTKLIIKGRGKKQRPLLHFIRNIPFALIF